MEPPVMTLKKFQIIETIAHRNGFTRVKSTETFETILEIIKSTLAFGDDVMISGFDKFSVKDKRERRGKNQATGENRMLALRRVVTLKSSEKLRDRVNGERKRAF